MNQDQLCELLKTKPLSQLTQEEMREARELAYSILRADYYGDVRGLAQSIAEDVKDGSIASAEDLDTRIHEDCDGNQRVIYTRLAQEAVILSDNCDNMIEEFGPEGIISDGSVNWSAMAYHAFRQDVVEQLSSEGIESDYWDNLEDEETDSAE